MRRAALPVAAILGIAGIAGADPWVVTMEAGAEADTNVTRIDGGPGLEDPIIAAVGRAGGRVDHKGRVLGGAYAFDVSALARMVGSEQARAKPENVMLYAGQARWLHGIESRPVAVGFDLLAADTVAFTDRTGARTFRNLGGDALAVLGSGEDRHLTLAIGGRDFAYKPKREFDWRGPVASARLDVALWQSSDKTRMLELATTLAFEARSFASTAIVNGCPPDAPPAEQCPQPTTVPRRDRYQRANAELSWTGEVVATAAYQLTVIDSNSYGQSLLRHRIMASATVELVDKLFGSATATLQIDQYPDSVLIEIAVPRQEFTNLEDESRSSLQLRIARELSAAWSLEARAAIWRDIGNIGGSISGTQFHRELVYTGVIYSH